MEEAIPRQWREKIEAIGTTDLLVGILGGGTEMPGADSGAAMVERALHDLTMPTRTVVLQTAAPPQVIRQSPNGSEAPTAEQASFVVLPALGSGSESISTVQSLSDVYRSIFNVAAKLEARACCVVVSNLETVTPRWFYLLSQPVLEMGYDLVTPCYGHRIFEGLMNGCMVSPLQRALYGQQIQNPMGPDLGFSQRVIHRVLANPQAKAAIDHPLASLTTAAVCGGLKLCQAYVGTRLYPATDWSTISSLLVQILDPIFADLESNAAFWQRVRGSRPVVAFGDPPVAEPGDETLDVARLIESFHLGIRDLREIWALILPPSTLFELTKLSRLPQEQFRMPDQLWARVIFDFALGHHLRVISRDHLLRAMTPLYLGWAASYALEVKSSGGDSASVPLDRLAEAFESTKPYFVSRWRWPDRFNP